MGKIFMIRGFCCVCCEKGIFGGAVGVGSALPAACGGGHRDADEGECVFGDRPQLECVYRVGQSELQGCAL